MILNVLFVSIVGGILCLDRVFIQTQISRPIVAGPVIGMILGDPATGIVAGALIELFWIDRLPIGAYIPPNDTIVSVLIAAGAIESGRILGNLTQGMVALAVLIYIPVGLVQKKLDKWMIIGNEALAKEAANGLGKGDIRPISRNHLRAALRGWMLPTAMILVALPLGIAMMTVGYPLLDAWMVRGLDLVYGILPLIGAAVAFNSIRRPGAIPIFCVAFLMTGVALRYLGD